MQYYKEIVTHGRVSIVGDMPHPDGEWVRRKDIPPSVPVSELELLAKETHDLTTRLRLEVLIAEAEKK